MLFPRPDRRLVRGRRHRQAQPPVREQPFIAWNITFTRQAYALDRVTQQEFPAEISLKAADPDHNQDTLKNIRLWDWHALQDTLRQIQEIRTYYDFPTSTSIAIRLTARRAR